MAKDDPGPQESLTPDELNKRANQVRETLEALLSEVKKLIKQTKALSDDMIPKLPPRGRDDSAH